MAVFISAPREDLNLDLQIRNLLLYPTELRGQIFVAFEDLLILSTFHQRQTKFLHDFSMIVEKMKVHKLTPSVRR